jgi:FixJ family two-component response regulator
MALIAVIDDDATVRHSLTRLLKSADYEVAQYSLGAEFLNALRTAA